MEETVYVKLDKKIPVYKDQVTLADLGEVWCGNPSIMAKCRSITVYHMHQERQIGSIMEVIAAMHSGCPGIQVENQGEQDFVLERAELLIHKAWLEWLRLAGIWLIVFLGAAFAIMTFNEDVSVGNVFEALHVQLTGAERADVTWLEYGYILGLPAGILLFYNHFSGKKKKADPTPLEVEMRTYEKDLYTTMVENHERQKSAEKRAKETGGKNK